MGELGEVSKAGEVRELEVCKYVRYVYKGGGGIKSDMKTRVLFCHFHLTFE